MSTTEGTSPDVWEVVQQISLLTFQPDHGIEQITGLEHIL